MKFLKINGLFKCVSDTETVTGETVTVSRAEFAALEDLAAGKSGPAIQAAGAHYEAENSRLRARVAELEKTKGATTTTRTAAAVLPKADQSRVDQLRASLASETDATKRANISREIRTLTSNK